MENGLIIINTVVSLITLALVVFLLYLQVKKPATQKEPVEEPTATISNELLPELSFYNGKVHNNGLVSMKLKNTGGKIEEIRFTTTIENTDFRCGTEKLESGQETTISIVPQGFNFSDNYFESNDILFSVNYKSLLNDYLDEQYRIENPGTIIKTS